METIQENIQELPAMECEEYNTNDDDGQEIGEESQQLHDSTADTMEPSEPIVPDNNESVQINTKSNEEAMDINENGAELDEHESIIEMEEKLLESTREKLEKEETTENQKSDSGGGVGDDGHEDENVEGDNKEQDQELDNNVGSSKANSSNEDDLSSKDGDTDKGSEGTKSQTNDRDNQETINQSLEMNDQAGQASLGRNRRVRQKNRYFEDFHCTDLTKGGRSNKCEYDTATTAGTRSSNRKSAASNHSQNSQLIEDPEKLASIKVYCRKCREKTAYSEDGGCQVCLYNRIKESLRRKALQKHKSRQSQDTPPATTSRRPPSGSSSKRKPTKKSSGSRSQSQQSKNTAATTSPASPKFANSDEEMEYLERTAYLPQLPEWNDMCATRPNNQYSETNNSNEVQRDTIKSEPLDSVDAGAPASSEDIASEDAAPVALNNNETTTNSLDKNDISDVKLPDTNIKLPKLDSWTPEEVADYILSKGFSDEAELFKTQSVDGISLLLMQRTDFTYGLKIKLGPALKIYDQVCKLKREYFKTVSATS